MCLLFTQSPIPELQATANIHLTQCSTTGKHLQISEVKFTHAKQEPHVLKK